MCVTIFFSNSEMNLFRRSSQLIVEQFGARIQKIPVDAGFTCPNLDGTLSLGGCIYCSNSSFSPFYADRKLSIKKQIEHGINYFGKRYKCQRFFAYFQSFSCTYAPAEVLEQRFAEAALIDGIEGLVIATRPDCIDAETIRLLQKMQKQTHIRIEVGIESFNNKTLRLANRCHTSEQALSTTALLKESGIGFTIHLIFGLPEEINDFPADYARTISSCGCDMVKLHHLQVLKNSPLEKILANNPDFVQLYSLSRYIDDLCRFIANLSPDIAIDRFINRVKPDNLLGPIFNISNEGTFQGLVEDRLRELNLYQGIYYSK